jgi:hypothetical protein
MKSEAAADHPNRADEDELASLDRSGPSQATRDLSKLPQAS